jgi:hypothetical protein
MFRGLNTYRLRYLNLNKITSNKIEQSFIEINNEQTFFVCFFVSEIRGKIVLLLNEPSISSKIFD